MLTIPRIFSFFLVFTLAFSQMDAQISARLSPDKETEDRRVSNFSKIKISSALTVHIRQGDTESLRVEATSKMIDQIVTEVRGGVLNIYVEGRPVFKGNPEIYLTFKDLDGIKVTGASKLTGDQIMNFEDLELHVNGASRVEMGFEANDLDLDINGASRVKMKGKAESIRASLSGASSLKADELKVEAVNMEVTGASSAKIAVSKELMVDATGASTVRYKGEPKTVNVDTAGASLVKQMEY